jgi:tetratricopeptide (TPR) repeat protein
MGVIKDKKLQNFLSLALLTYNYSMRNILTFLLVLLYLIPLTAQNDKYTDKLFKLYNNKEYYKIMDFKSKKIPVMEANSLYLKGMGCYMSGYDKKNIEFMDMAIAKGPVDYRFYYFKSLSEKKIKKFESAIKSIDLSIGLLPDDFSLYAVKGDIYYDMEKLDLAIQEYKIAATYEDAEEYIFRSLGDLSMQVKNYSEAELFYKEALAQYKEDSRDYKNVNFNIGLCQQLAMHPSDSKNTFENHIKLFPEDYPAYSKLIQANYALNNYDVTAYLNVLFDAYENNDLPRNYKTRFCLDQYDYKGVNVKFFRNYEENDNEPIVKRNLVFVADSLEEVDYIIYACLDTIGLAKDTTTRKYIWYKLKDDTLYGYVHQTFDSETLYPNVKEGYMQIINGSANTISTQPDFEAWLEEHSVQPLQGNGNSFASAIKVESISEEYAYLREYFPGYKLIQQSLVFNDGLPYDILEFKTKEGKNMEIYFDISKFFGKY